MSLAWFGCEAGASGDMFLGALVDAGAPLDVMQSAVDAIGVEHVGLRAREVTRAGLAAIQVEVRAPRSDVVRTWGNIRGLLRERRPRRGCARPGAGRVCAAGTRRIRCPPGQP
jgi:uncharacterized protein (DUF111 family)